MNDLIVADSTGDNKTSIKANVKSGCIYTKGMCNNETVSSRRMAELIKGGQYIAVLYLIPKDNQGLQEWLLPDI